jgi:hypothetical protein
MKLPVFVRSYICLGEWVAKLLARQLASAIGQLSGF